MLLMHDKDLMKMFSILGNGCTVKMEFCQNDYIFLPRYGHMCPYLRNWPLFTD